MISGLSQKYYFATPAFLHNKNLSFKAYKLLKQHPPQS